MNAYYEIIDMLAHEVYEFTPDLNNEEGVRNTVRDAVLTLREHVFARVEELIRERGIDRD